MQEQAETGLSAGTSRRTVAFVLQHLESGGVESVVLKLLNILDRQRFRPVLVLLERRGPLLDGVAADVVVRDLGSPSARRSILLLKRAFAELDPDVIYAGTNAVILACLAAAGLRGGRPPVIIGQHTTPNAYLREAKLPRIRLALMRWLYPRAAVIAAPALELGEEIRKMVRSPTLPLVAVPNPVYERLPSSAGAQPARNGSPHFLAAGRLAPVKGFDVLLGAFALLCREEPAARLTICGEGEERGALQALSHRLGIADRVELAGYVQNPIQTLGSGRIFVMSSRREGFPNVLVEALAAGMPIVASDCPVGPRLVLQGGQFGLLVPPEDPEALRDGMLRLHRDGALADGFRRHGPARAAPFEVRAAARAFADLFEAVARPRPTIADAAAARRGI